MTEPKSKEEIINEIHGISLPFPASPKEGDKFRRFRQPNPITKQPGETVTYVYTFVPGHGYYWLTEEASP